MRGFRFKVSRFKLCALGMLGVYLCPGMIRAQEPPAVTLEEAVRLGIDNSRTLHASLMEVDTAVARYDASRAALLPGLKFTGGYDYLSSVPEFTLQTPPPDSRRIVINPSINNTYQFHLTAQQPLYTGNRLEGAKKMAALNALAARRDMERETLQLGYRIKAAYWDIHRAAEMLRVVEENIRRMEAHLEDVKNLLAEGMATTNDVLKAETQISAVRLMRVDARNGLDISRMTLNNALGLPLDLRLELATPLPETFPKPGEPDAAVRDALQSRPELLAGDLRLKAAETAVKVAGADKLPQVFLSGNYISARPNSRIFPGEDRFHETWDVGVGVSLSLWDWKSTDLQVRQARFQAEKARDALGTAADGVRLEVRTAALRFQGALEKLAESSVGQRQADENLRVTKERFREDLVTSSEVLDAEVALLQAELQRTQARVDAAVAQAALDLAVGRE
jgi:outer membrane protein